jgi:hypothetical protein
MPDIRTFYYGKIMEDAGGRSLESPSTRVYRVNSDSDKDWAGSLLQFRVGTMAAKNKKLRIA